LTNGRDFNKTMSRDVASRADWLGSLRNLNMRSPIQHGGQLGDRERIRVVMMKLQNKKQMQLQQYGCEDNR
jgi:hypothetical protein